MPHDSPFDLLVPHAVRLTGFADTPAVADRFGLGVAATAEALRAAEARGWVTHTAFAGTAGWSLTEAGRAENERRLAVELGHTGRAAEVRRVYRDFLPWNAWLRRACTDWQLRPAPGDPLAANDHADPAWDAAVLRELAAVDRAVGPLVARLTGVLSRFRGYDTRFGAALRRAAAGDGGWVDRTDLDSCHRVWFELHEDLVATLGIDRNAEP
ncbi:transcriptional regulator [Streptomyces sp. DSM 44915]|uniref:Transcriptional regulator n=1 Tax=Streptomyces chisholmiae TaxID=3075540 RepID=A0ABU2JRB3_9ACTN|nr:transcriptional regulator [Streptomyces sp. DSM 44915]MDT0266768.1 transcriptional regulator [Streptomyces sp. DSM 44915]